MCHRPDISMIYRSKIDISVIVEIVSNITDIGYIDGYIGYFHPWVGGVGYALHHLPPNNPTPSELGTRMKKVGQVLSYSGAAMASKVHCEASTKSLMVFSVLPWSVGNLIKQSNQIICGSKMLEYTYLQSL